MRQFQKNAEGGYCPHPVKGPAIRRFGCQGPYQKEQKTGEGQQLVKVR